MDFLTKIWNYIKCKITGEKQTQPVQKSPSAKQPIFNTKKNTPNPNEIPIIRDITDEQIELNKTRPKYITSTKNPDYKIKNGDNIEKIAEKFGVETRSILAQNGLTNESAKKIRAGQILKIPNTRKVRNVKNLNDVAKSMGVSIDFIKKLKTAEDGNIPLNKFHNTPYTDDAGVKTIGIGHVLKKKESQKLSNTEVCDLFAKDLLKAEENLVAVLGSQKVYDRIPQGLKEAVLDLTFNKGIVDDESFKKLIYCLKNQKWEAGINQLVFNKSTTTKKEMSGLNKRRLFDISLATKIYENKIPPSNKNTAQNLYNRGVELLRQECKKSGSNFKNILAGYNKDIQGYFKNRLDLEYVTE